GKLVRRTGPVTGNIRFLRAVTQRLHPRSLPFPEGAFRSIEPTSGQLPAPIVQGRIDLGVRQGPPGKTSVGNHQVRTGKGWKNNSQVALRILFQGRVRMPLESKDSLREHWCTGVHVEGNQ